MVQLVDVSHAISFRRGRPQDSQHTRPDSEKLRAKILQLFSVLVGGLGGGDVKIRLSWLLTWLPESDFCNVPQIPRQRLGIGGNHGDARRCDCILVGQHFDLCRQPEQIFRGVGIGIRIGFIGRMDKDAMPRIVED
jgi:hypothetical protein